MTKERILVTAALPYANGPVHIGHAVGAYVPADVYARYHRLKGNDVLYICGTDEHGTPITVSAEAEGVSPQKIVDKYHKIQADAFEKLGVSFDNFSGTARKPHYELSQHFFKAALDKNLLEKKTVERPYCQSCGKFLPDRYVKGSCPHCSAADQRGDQCESCGKQLEPHELLDAYCSICGGAPEMRETTHWFFKLGQMSGRLEEWIAKNTHWPANARNFALGWIREGLESRAITRDMNWGIPVPVEGAEGKVLYVWFDAPIGYVSSTREWGEKNKRSDWEDYWRGDSKIVHFIGKDNIPFHTIIWPAVLMAEGSYNLPWQIASNEFLNLEGRKMSTSRGWVIWLHDILSEFDADVVRYYLISIAPEKHDSDFSLGEFADKVNGELLSKLGNFVHRTLTFIESREKGVVPEAGRLDEDDERLVAKMTAAPDEIGASIENLRMMEAQSKVIELASAGNEYFQRKEPWKGDAETTLNLCVNLVAELAIVMHPFLPNSSEKIWETLRLEGSVGEKRWDTASKRVFSGGERIGKPKPLYKKIEAGKIQKFKEKYLPAGEKQGKEEVKEMVSFEEFEKMDLRVGEIMKVEEHPSADKLYVVEVDLGGMGKRELVAGVRESYKPDELAGKKIVVIVNLEPAKIRGVKSEGMLLAAADDDGKPTLLTVDKDAPNGSKIM